MILVNFAVIKYAGMKTILETDQEFKCDINAPCFRLLNQEEAELIRQSKTQVLFRKGDILTKQGAFTSYVLFIIHGLARQYLELPVSRNFNLRIIRPGEFAGLNAVFTNNTFNYSSMALTDCQAYLIEKDTITEVSRQNGDFGISLVKRYLLQNGDLYHSIINLASRQMNGRLAESLLYIESIKAEYPAIFQLLSRKDLADFAGISTENTVKVLKSFEKDNIIHLNEKDIEILDINGLREISRRG